jgi:hypothetical protein
LLTYTLYIVVCLIGCSALQHSKTPWEHVTKTTEVMDEEIRFHFIKDFEALYQKHKHGSKEFCLKIADLIVAHATVISAKLCSATSSN